MSYQKQTKSSLKTRKSSVTRRPVLTLAFLLLFIGVVFATIKIVQAISQPANDQPQVSQPDNKTSEKSNTTNTSSSDSSSTTTSDNKTPAQYAGDNPNEKDSITGIINYAAKQGDTLRIRVSIDQSFETAGTCELKINKEDDVVVYTASAPTETVAGASTCYQAFDVPAGNYSGEYTIYVTINAGDKTGTIERKVSL